ncbi:unnamed protein product [Acanthosepion pharaonis]|uniref:Uncharacterized protein n=1 Tax=Acanthosepion pharaonis TaxID=158019 RepID=A0A812EP46_ACAPH|nr:unnamed protein product [Sepia pharaonis]
MQESANSVISLPCSLSLSHFTLLSFPLIASSILTYPLSLFCSLFLYFPNAHILFSLISPVSVLLSLFSLSFRLSLLSVDLSLSIPLTLSFSFCNNLRSSFSLFSLSFTPFFSFSLVFSVSLVLSFHLLFNLSFSLPILFPHRFLFSHSLYFSLPLSFLRSFSILSFTASQTISHKFNS